MVHPRDESDPQDDRQDREFDDIDSSTSATANLWPLALLIAVGLVGYVALDGVEAETYSYSVDEAVAKGSWLVGQHVRVRGEVEPGSIVGQPGTLDRTFRIAKKGKTLQVTYDRALPDTFEENVEVVARGTVNKDYTLVADEVLVKCPSRYEGRNAAPKDFSGGPKASADAPSRSAPQARR